MEFLTDKTTQSQLFFASSYRDLLDLGDEVWDYIKLFSEMNYKEFHAKYSGEGQSPIDPELILRTIFYGLQKGIISGRKLSEACRFDVRFIILSGSLTPDRRTLDRFFVRHEKTLEVFFKQIVQVAMTKGLVDLKNVAVDGTRLKGHTKSSGSSYDSMKRAKEYIAENLKKLASDLEGDRETEKQAEILGEMKLESSRTKKIDRAIDQIEKEDKDMQKTSKNRNPIGERKKSLNDPEALEMSYRSNSRAYMFGYNPQVAVDEKNQIILACHLHDKATDYQALKPVLDQVEEVTGSHPESVLCDAGYNSQENICAVYGDGMAPIFAAKSVYETDQERPHAFEQLTYDSSTDVYHCLAGQQLSYFKRNRGEKSEVKLPKGCDLCLRSPECIFFKNKTKTLVVPNAKSFEQMKKHAETTRTEAYKKHYATRKKIVEPVFGNIKHNKRFMLSVTGRSRISTRFLCICIAHNLEKILGRGPRPILNYWISWAIALFNIQEEVTITA